MKIYQDLASFFDTGKISKHINTFEHYKTTTNLEVPNLRFRTSACPSSKHKKIRPKHYTQVVL